MKLIVGLGNPGDKFNFTRHNFGFLALDFYFKRNNMVWEKKPFLGALRAKKGDVIFIKPQEFYNLSGQPVAAYMRYYKIDPADVLVICDNFDLEFGKTRFRTSGVAGGNNGLKSVDKELGTSEYPRLRLGTENETLKNQIGAVDFVLSKFTPEEKEKLPGILNEVVDKINEFILA